MGAGLDSDLPCIDRALSVGPGDYGRGMLTTRLDVSVCLCVCVCVFICLCVSHCKKKCDGTPVYNSTSLT